MANGGVLIRLHSYSNNKWCPSQKKDTHILSIISISIGT